MIRPQKKKPPDKHNQKTITRQRLVTSATRISEGLIRLNKFIAETGVASRRKADELISSGKVKVNNRVVTELGIKINVAVDNVRVNDEPVYLEPKLIYILVNKPKDCITTVKDEKGRTTVLDLVPDVHRVFPIGRLDRHTTGALLLTNDGELAYRLMHPKFGVIKTYSVEIDQSLRRHHLIKLLGGMDIDEERTAPCEALILDPPARRKILIRLHEGKNRQVRRMFEALGYHVTKLDRVDYAGLTTQGLKRGEWRYLHEQEVRHLKKLVG